MKRLLERGKKGVLDIEERIIVRKMLLSFKEVTSFNFFGCITILIVKEEDVCVVLSI